MEMTRQEFDKLAKQNNWEVYTQRQVYQFSQDILKSVDPIEREHGAIDYVSLNRVTVVNDDLTKSVVYWREQQVEWDEAEDGTLMKARSGVYKDTPANRKKGIVGQRYGGKKEETLEEKKEKYGSESTKEAIGRAKKDAKLSDGELEAKVAKFRERGPKTEEEWSLAREYRDRKASKDNKKKTKTDFQTDAPPMSERLAKRGFKEGVHVNYNGNSYTIKSIKSSKDKSKTTVALISDSDEAPNKKVDAKKFIGIAKVVDIEKENEKDPNYKESKEVSNTLKDYKMKRGDMFELHGHKYRVLGEKTDELGINRAIVEYPGYQGKLQTHEIMITSLKHAKKIDDKDFN